VVYAIFSVDVEDWFHYLLPTGPDISIWDRHPSRLEKSFMRMLDLFDEKGIKATHFFLGYSARRDPSLVKRASDRGHEIASHGYSHRLIINMTPREFSDEIRQSKLLLEDMIGKPVKGFRAPCFSITDKTPWFFEKLIEAGYLYDSSVYPVPRNHYGLNFGLEPKIILAKSGKIIEFPITVIKVFGRIFSFSGGIRLYPHFFIKYLALLVMKQGRPVIFHIHPPEIDLDMPIPTEITLRKRFISHANLKTVDIKMKKILSSFEYITFDKYIYKYFKNKVS
jgi:polysaccharide deacetylase family protein (PEP-CTERM system associated)